MADISGPVHQDPRTLVKDTAAPSEAEALINNKLREISTSRDPKESMAAFVDSLYTTYQNTMDTDTYMTVEEFRKYEILFSRQVRDDYLAGKLDTAAVEQITSLSDEFYKRVNPQRPIHIVDNKGKDVLPPLPPIFRPLRKLTGDGVKVVDILHNAFLHADDVPNSPSTIRQKQAVDALGQMVMAAQDKDTILQDVEETSRLADNFHKAVFGKSVFNTEDEVTKAPEPTKEDHSNASSFMAFGAVDE